MTIETCWIDNHGNRVDEPIPHMQSEEWLRDSIRRGYRTAECWAVLKANNKRVLAGMAAIEKSRKENDR